MCCTNGGTATKMAGDVRVGNGVAGDGANELSINAGAAYASAASDFAISELMVWDRALDDTELSGASSYLQGLLGSAR